MAIINEENQYEANNYVGFPCLNSSFLTIDECNKVIELGKALPVVEGSVTSATDASRIMHLHTRSSKIKWLAFSPDTAWIFEKMRDAINIANGKYRFDLDDDFVSLQLAEYSVGGHYVWHSDVGAGDTSFRKLSLTVQLSSPDDYNGGELEFMVKPGIPEDKQRKQGSAIIFPSFLEHRVTTVTKGSRWSIVAWICGPPFR